MTDFFISYTSKDKDWAEWVGFALEAEGFRIIIQAWDFRPGSHFPLEMQHAAQVAKRTILILSPDYLKSDFAASEWAAAFVNDPRGLERKVLPVMVRTCEPEGVLKSIVQIRLVGLTEDVARVELLLGVENKRAKPSSSPPFPGDMTISPPKTFPGGEISELPISFPTNILPEEKKSPTDKLSESTENSPISPAHEPKNDAGFVNITRFRNRRFFKITVSFTVIFGGLFSLIFTFGDVHDLCQWTGLCAADPVPVLANYDTDWMAGGHNQNEQCEPLRAKYAAEHPNFTITFEASENSRKDFIGHVTYQYHCKYTASRK